MDDLERYAVVSAGFGTRVAGLDDWEAMTPCAPWTVSDLVEHVVATHDRVLGTAPTIGPLPRRWRTAQMAVHDALADPVRAVAMRQTPLGEMGFATQVGGLLCASTLVHTWDLARASGQDEGLEADAVAECHAFLLPVASSLRGPAGYGPALLAPAGANAQDALLAFSGRQV
jgi:uncharacterized protein (TIGR03086 family)